MNQCLNPDCLAISPQNSKFCQKCGHTLLLKERYRPLKLKRGIDYSKLEQLLANFNWKEADRETTRLMLAIMGKESSDYLTYDDCRNFPASELKIIDQLWIKYSKGHFGFSMQKQIWIECGGTPGEWNVDLYRKFADRIGWRKKEYYVKYEELTFDTSSPKAHLPGFWRWEGYGISFLFSRL